MLLFNLLQSVPAAVISLQGRFDSSGALQFDEHISNIDTLFPVIDFTEVSFLSSAGIRVLIKAEKSHRAKNSKLVLCGVSEGIKQVLEITGLINQFTIVISRRDAEELAASMKNSADSRAEVEMQGHSYSVNHLTPAPSRMEMWLPKEQDKNNLIAVNLDVFRFAIGYGGLGTTREQVSSASGSLILTNKLIGILPGAGKPDYLLSNNPSDSHFFISSAINISGKPNVFVKSDNSSNEIKDVIRNSFSFLSDKTGKPISLAGFVIAADVKNDNSFISIGFIADKFTGKIPEALDKWSPALEDENIKCYAMAAALNKSISSCPGEDVDNIISDLLCDENIADIVTLPQNREIGPFKMWMFLPDLIDAQTQRLNICFDENIEVKDEFEVITRKIYSDCSRINLKQLHGGFSAKTFQVFGYDRKGIRILPTVLKLAKRATIKREVVNYDEHVKRYILNNSTSVMGSCFYGDWGGVRYNFVGITGPDSRIGWLTDLYRTNTPEELLPLFDRIFTDILRPWYGQPRLETFYAYKEHNPTTVFFRELFEECELQLGINADQEKVYFEELGREIINPYWFLKYGYKEREKKSKLWYKCICHGDLNMQNILLDEIRNIYIIDYSETMFRNAVSDFARLEPIFKFEFPVINQAEMKNLIQFENGLLTPNTLEEIPEFTYPGSDPYIKKAYKIICRLRKYAKTVTLFENDLVPYLLAVLEWTYAVVCYQSVDVMVKKYSAISAALICEKILQLEKNG